MAVSRKLVVPFVAGVLFVGVGVSVAKKTDVTGEAAPVTLATAFRPDSYSESVAEAVEKEAAEAQVEINMKPVEARSTLARLDSLMEARDSGTKAVILAPASLGSARAAVDFLQEGGVPVISLGCYPSLGKDVSCVTPDYEAAGIQAADVLAKASGESGTIVFYEGNQPPFYIPELKRGFRKGLAKYPNIKVIDEYTNYQGEVLPILYSGWLKEVLENNPDVKGVFSYDQLVWETFRSIESTAGSNASLLGFGRFPDFQDAIKSGEVLGAIDPQAELVGKEAMKQAEAILEGKTPQAEKRIEVLMIDSSNVSEFE